MFNPTNFWCDHIIVREDTNKANCFTYERINFSDERQNYNELSIPGSYDTLQIGRSSQHTKSGLQILCRRYPVIAGYHVFVLPYNELKNNAVCELVRGSHHGYPRRYSFPVYFVLCWACHSLLRRQKVLLTHNSNWTSTTLPSAAAICRAVLVSVIL